jgi:RNA-directed DNA polymerase
MTFSTFSSQACPDRLVRVVKQIVADEGFGLAQQKLCIQRKGARQSVTGLVVNSRVNVAREERRRLRAIIHNCRSEGVESQNRDNCPYFLEQLQGHVAFVMGVNTYQGEQLRRALDELI